MSVRMHYVCLMYVLEVLLRDLHVFNDDFIHKICKFAYVYIYIRT